MHDVAHTAATARAIVLTGLRFLCVWCATRGVVYGWCAVAVPCWEVRQLNFTEHPRLRRSLRGRLHMVSWQHVVPFGLKLTGQHLQRACACLNGLVHACSRCQRLPLELSTQW